MTNPSLEQTRETLATRARATILLSGLIVFAMPTRLAADRLVAGQYEMTSTIDGKTTTAKYCASPEIAKGTNGDAKSVRAYLESSVKSCSIQAFDLTGDTISYSLTCAGHTTAFRAVYHGDHFESDMTSSVNGQSRTIHTTAKRVGVCKVG